MEGFFPEKLKEQFREIQTEVKKVKIYGTDLADRVEYGKLSQKNARRLIGKVISLREQVAEEYYKRQVKS